MKKFERPALHEVQTLTRQLSRKSLADIIASFGTPTRELGASRIQRRYRDGRVDIIQYLCTFEFSAVTPTIFTLVVSERTGGRLDFAFRGKPIQYEIGTHQT